MHISQNDRVRMLRPALYQFDADNLGAEFYRWFDLEKKARPRPLDEDELVKFLVGQRGCSIKEARADVRENSNAKKGDKQLWLMVQNPLVDRVIEALLAEINKYDLEVMSRYPNDLLIHDRNMLMMNAVPGARLAWTVYENSTRMIPLGLTKQQNEEVTYGTNTSSRQRFYELTIGYGSFKLKEVFLKDFEALCRVPVPYRKEGANECFSLMKGDFRIGVVRYTDVGNYNSRKYEVEVTPVASLSAIDTVALSAWADRGAVDLAHTLFVRTHTTWNDSEAKVLAA